MFIACSEDQLDTARRGVIFHKGGDLYGEVLNKTSYQPYEWGARFQRSNYLGDLQVCEATKLVPEAPMISLWRAVGNSVDPTCFGSRTIGTINAAPAPHLSFTASYKFM
jgi:hypothetical protein